MSTLETTESVSLRLATRLKLGIASLLFTEKWNPSIVANFAPTKAMTSTLQPAVAELDFVFHSLAGDPLSVAEEVKVYP